MEKTTTEMIIPGGSPSTSENPPSTETGLKDSGQGQPLLDRSPYRGNTKITKLSTNKEDNTSDTNTNILGKKLDNNNNKVKLQQTLPLEFFQGRARSNSTNSVEDLQVKYRTRRDKRFNLAGGYHKKRPRNSPESSNPKGLKSSKTETYWLGSPLSLRNRYEQLEMDEQGKADTPLEIKKPKPPPIFVVGVTNISPLTTLLDNIAKGEYMIKIINNTQVKIQPGTSEKYTTIIKELKERNTDFHTYKIKQERSFQVILKKHASLNQPR